MVKNKIDFTTINSYIIELEELLDEVDMESIDDKDRQLLRDIYDYMYPSSSESGGYYDNSNLAMIVSMSAINSMNANVSIINSMNNTMF